MARPGTATRPIDLPFGGGRPVHRLWLLRLLLVLAAAGAACGGAEGERDAPDAGETARMQAIAERFVAEWAKGHRAPSSGGKCVLGPREFNSVHTGWCYSFDAEDLGVAGYVSVSQELVVDFIAYGHGLSAPQWKNGRYLSDDERLTEVRKLIRIPLAKARERASSFLAAVYPRFRQRQFQLMSGKLRILNDATYTFRWREAFDPAKPTAFPNHLEIDINPATGMIVAYSAEDYRLPGGFKLGLTREQALKKAHDAARPRLEDPDWKLNRGPLIRFAYVPAKDMADADRICWAITYRFAWARDDTFLRHFTFYFDAATGERLDERLLRR